MIKHVKIFQCHIILISAETHLKCLSLIFRPQLISKENFIMTQADMLMQPKLTCQTFQIWTCNHEVKLKVFS